MITLPDFTKKWDYENAFYLTSEPVRLAKLMAHYELYRLSQKLPGAIVECGVFKGASLIRFRTFEEVFNHSRRQTIAFDSFGKFPPTSYSADRPRLKKYIAEAGADSISTSQLRQVFRRKNLGSKVQLVKGNIVTTVPAYVRSHPQLKISLLHIDTDVFEPAVVILEYLFPRLVKGGVLVLDDYGKFPGETKAVNDYLGKKKKFIKHFSFAKSPHYYIKR